MGNTFTFDCLRAAFPLLENMTKPLGVGIFKGKVSLLHEVFAPEAFVLILSKIGVDLLCHIPVQLLQDIRWFEFGRY